MVFDQRYYDSIWGSVHRHDYCDYWASELIRRFGRGCSVLDIGTGCGFLVKTLRERGCDAWGIDSSEYAIDNTCAPGHVLNASVTDVPFKDDRFDAVFSNGLWEYLALEEIAKGRDEIWRIGRHQVHNIDHDGCDYREDCVTRKPPHWWDEQLAAPKVFVSCPTHESKEYAHGAWVEMASTINYPNYDIFVVDNSPSPDCARRWGFEHVEVEGHQAQRMAAAMEVARQRFLSGPYRWWWNVEIDVIPDPQMLRTLLRYGKDADWTAHCYPSRGETEECCSGIGCSLWSRRLIEDYSFAGTGDFVGQGVDAYMWNWVRPKKEKYKTRECWGHLPIAHLKEPDA